MCPLARRRRVPLRAALAKVSSLLVAVAVLLGVVHAGARYFYCEGLGLSTTDPCLQAATHTSPCPSGAFDRPELDCCRVITMPSMPEGARSIVPVAAPAGFVAVLPPVQRADASPWNGSDLFVREGERGRAPPASSGERRARLMVFLT
jgi:hypothetical protein